MDSFIKDTVRLTSSTMFKKEYYFVRLLYRMSDEAEVYRQFSFNEENSKRVLPLLALIGFGIRKGNTGFREKIPFASVIEFDDVYELLSGYGRVGIEDIKIESLNYFGEDGSAYDVNLTLATLIENFKSVNWNRCNKETLLADLMEVKPRVLEMIMELNELQIVSFKFGYHFHDEDRVKKIIKENPDILL